MNLFYLLLIFFCIKTELYKNRKAMCCFKNQNNKSNML